MTRLHTVLRGGALLASAIGAAYVAGVGLASLLFERHMRSQP